jgi:Omp85 superfamily domain
MKRIPRWAVLAALFAAPTPTGPATAGAAGGGPPASGNRELAEGSADRDSLAVPVPAGAAASSFRADSDSAARAGTPDPTAPDPLVPTTSVPWNPPRPVTGEQPWETALRLPGTIASLPLKVLGAGADASLLYIEDHHLVPRIVALLASIRGTHLELGVPNLGERTGTGILVGYRPHGLSRWTALEWSGTTIGYSRTAARVEAGPARLEYRYDWRPRERFFGIGMDAAESDESRYAWQSEDVRLGLNWSSPGRPHAPPPLSLSGWFGPRSAVVRHAHGGDETPIEVRFPALTATTLDQRVEHLVYGIGVTFDQRVGHPHWSRGVQLSVSGERFDRPISLFALHTARPEAAEFTRLTVEAQGAISFMRDPRTIRVSLKAIDQNIDDRSAQFVFPDLVSLGGGEGLRGFEPRRFQDVDMLVGRLTYLFPLSQHFEFDIHAEAGGVYGDLTDEPRFASLETSYGVALRPRTVLAPLGFVGVDWSREAVRFRFGFGAGE